MTAGRRRGLAQLATVRGAYALGMLAEAEPLHRPLLCSSLAPHTSGVVLDPATAAECALDGTLPGRTGLAVDLGERSRDGLTRLRAGTSPASVRRLGASAAYLRVPLRPDRPDRHGRALRTARLASLTCHEEDLPICLHLAVDPLPGESAPSFWQSRDRLAVEALADLERCDADLLVLPVAAGRHATSAWICALTSFEAWDLEAEVDEAIEADASGFAIGRALWHSTVDHATLLDTAAPVMAALRERAEAARPAQLAW